MSDPTKERLERLRRASLGVRPSADFGDRVMTTLASPRSGEVVRPSGFWQVTSRLRFVGIAAIAAIVTLFVAIKSDVETDDLVASSYATPEVDW